MAYLRSNLVIWPLLLFVLAALCLIFWPSLYSAFHAFDIEILRSVHTTRLNALDPFFIFVTNSSSMLCIAVTFIIALLAFIKRSSTLKQKTLQLITTLLVSTVVIKALKYLIGRARPFQSYEFLETLVVTDSPSFPSGHTFEAFAFATALVLLFKNRWINLVILLWALTVSLSRMVLGVHYLSDVIGGIILGVLTAFAIHAFFSKKAGVRT